MNHFIVVICIGLLSVCGLDIVRSLNDQCLVYMSNAIIIKILYACLRSIW